MVGAPMVRRCRRVETIREHAAKNTAGHTAHNLDERATRWFFTSVVKRSRTPCCGSYSPVSRSVWHRLFFKICGVFRC
jgi:hypothetical protein